jgi:hypothetical protein
VKLGVVIPAVSLVVLLLAVLIVVLLVVIKRKGNKSDDWEINYQELEIGEQLGAGGYVHERVRQGPGGRGHSTHQQICFRMTDTVRCTRRCGRAPRSP